MTLASSSDDAVAVGGAGRWTIAMFALIGLGLGLVYSSVRSSTYEAQALVSVTNPQGPLAEEVAFAESPTVLGTAERLLGFAPEVTITAAQASQLLTITATASDADDAANAANVVAATYSQAQLGAPATITATAEVPTAATGSGPMVFASLGTALGALFGALIGFLRGIKTRQLAEAPPAIEASPNRGRRRDFIAREAGVGEMSGSDGAMLDWDSEPEPGADAFAALAPSALGANTDSLPDFASPPSHVTPVHTPIDDMVDFTDPQTRQHPYSEPRTREPETPGMSADTNHPRSSSFSELSGLAESTDLSPRTRQASEQTSSLWSPATEAQAEATASLEPDPVLKPSNPAPVGSHSDLGPMAHQPAVHAPRPPSQTRSARPEAQPAAEPRLSPDLAEATPTAQHPSEALATEPLQPPVGGADARLEPMLTADAGPPPAGRPEQQAPGLATDELQQLDRRALQTQYETAMYERSLAHDQELAQLRTTHEQQTAALSAEVASLNNKLRVQTARIKNRSGTEQSRVGDLEAQLAAIESELGDVRETLETERIAHTKRLTEERGAADRALDNARRQYREELAKHTHTNRTALADHRVDLDRELADDRARHAAQLEQEHRQYEDQLEGERRRADERVEAASLRHERELTDLKATTQQALDKQTEHHKDTIAALRTTAEENERQLQQQERDNRALRAELQAQRKLSQDTQIETQTSTQRLSDELALMRAELEAERERNAALRADVLRRSAEAHQTIDRAVEERTAQLAELEATVERQREYADSRVREISASAEEKSREAAVREASLTATVSRLKRELEAAKNAATTQN